MFRIRRITDLDGIDKTDDYTKQRIGAKGYFYYPPQNNFGIVFIYADIPNKSMVSSNVVDVQETGTDYIVKTANSIYEFEIVSE